MTPLLHSSRLALSAFVCAFLFLEAKGANLDLYYGWGDNAAVERQTLIELRVSRSGSDGPQSVDYRVVSGTAEAGRDFVAATGTVHFQPGEYYQTFNVPLLEDSEIEGPEQFSVVLENPSPAATLDRAAVVLTIRDDEQGYALGVAQTPREDAPYVDVKVRRLGDFTFQSSVEVYLKPAPATDWSIPARPGIDYVNETFQVTFPAGVSEQTIRVALLNDSDEDGDRTLVARLRNPTGGVPISETGAIWVQIADNESGYRVTSALWHPVMYYMPTDVWEGASTGLYLLRSGDYNVPSTAIVSVSELDWPRAAAEAGADFIPRSFTIEFGPGQTIAPIPLEIIDDQIPEGAEAFNLSHPKGVTDPTVQDLTLYLRDNELNPLPIQRVCLGDDPRSGSSLQPARYLVAVRDGFLLQVNSEPWYRQPSQLIRLLNDGSIDPSFHPIDLGSSPIFIPTVLETEDRKYLVLYNRTLKRYLNNGDLDSSFQSFTAENIYNIAESSDRPHINTGKVITRLNLDGTVDPNFVSPILAENEFITDVVEGPNGTVYVHGWFVSLEFPLIRNISRLTESGVYDPAFIATDLNGTLFGHNGTLFIKEQNGRIQRISPLGGIDASFSPIEMVWGDVHGMDLEGNSYLQRLWFGGLRIEKYTRDGLVDPNFFPGETDLQSSSLRNAFSLDGTKLLFIPNTYSYSEINGVSPFCPTTPYGPGYGLALLDLAAPPRITAYPKATLLEREEGRPDIIDVVRTGPNASSPMRGSYRVRNGSAVNGRDFAMAETAELEFAPGVSRIELPIPIIDNTVADHPRNFFIDILSADGAVNSTVEIYLQNDDPGIQILGIENNRLQLSLIHGGYWTFDWTVSSDFENWESGYYTSTGYVVEIDLTGPGRFIKGTARWVDSYMDGHDTPVFSHR